MTTAYSARAAGARPRGGTRAALAAALITALMVAGAPAAAQTSIQGRTDLRCLTDREADCLPEPVSPEEPHGAVCATCHDMATQATKAEAAKTCASGGCHAQPESLTPFHRGLGPGVLADCIRCHKPHDSRIPDGGMRCELCHTAGARYEDPRSDERHPLPERPAALDLTFRHRQHESVECTACHGASPEHGVLKVTGLADCRSCHHSGSAASECETCHDPGETGRVATRVERTLDMQIGSLNHPLRSLPFDHADHERFECASCHSGPAVGAADTDCTRCHGMHHRPEATCAACHEPPVAGAHTRDAHLGCGGAGCHENAPRSVQEVPRTRTFCTVCHRDRVDHEPQGNCEDCHALPPPRPAGG